MFKFLIRLLGFLIILIFIDWILGYGCRWLYFSQKKGQFAQTTYSIDSTNQDILIFGSSKAVRHYSPLILSKTLGMSCYNVGRDAQMIPFYKAMQEAIFIRHKPKLIILDINPWELSPDKTKYEKLSILLPYCIKHPEFIKYVQNESKWERLKLLSQTYPYNSSLFILFYNFFFSSHLNKDANGYLPLTGVMNKKELDDYTANLKNEKQNNRVDLKAVNYYREFLQKTQQNNIKTYVIISPAIIKEQVNLKKKQILMAIAKEYKNVSFLDFSDDPRFNYKYKFFSDIYHLNKTGSEEFSKNLVHYFK